LSLNIKFICTRRRIAILPVSKARTNKFYFYRQCSYIVYLFAWFLVFFSQYNNYRYYWTLRHSSPFINVVKGVFFVVRATLVPVSFLSAPSAVHNYRVPGKFIRILRKVYSSSTNKANIYSFIIFVQQMYWLQDKFINMTRKQFYNNKTYLIILLLIEYCFCMASKTVFNCSVLSCKNNKKSASDCRINSFY
jgi:hypothetical protein